MEIDTREQQSFAVVGLGYRRPNLVQSGDEIPLDVQASGATLRRLLAAADMAALVLAFAWMVATVPSVSACALWAALTLPIWMLVFDAS